MEDILKYNIDDMYNHGKYNDLIGNSLLLF